MWTHSPQTSTTPSIPLPYPAQLTSSTDTVGAPMTFDTTALLDWYARVKRPLPWRATRDPYALLVSEVMLQQTQAARVVPYFEAFLARFPDPQALAAAPRGTCSRPGAGSATTGARSRSRPRRGGWPSAAGRPT